MLSSLRFNAPYAGAMLTPLYMAADRLTSLRELSGFPRLTTLCLFRNHLSSLDDALPHLRALPRLRDLDLDGNPCAGTQHYRHRVVRDIAHSY
jgi:Leucine-rich repeat (LRR) protein